METLADHIYYDVQNAPEARFLRSKLQAMVEAFNIDVESSPYGLPVCRRELGSIQNIQSVDAVSRGCQQARQEVRTVLKTIGDELSQVYD
jgi:hypothetical protein